jgi:hypothetical protein
VNEQHPDAPSKVVPGRGGSGIEGRISEKMSGSNRGARSPGKHHQARLRVGKCTLYHLRATNLHLPPPSIALQSRFTWHAQNQATNTQFWVWGLNPTPQPCVGECTDPLVPLCHPPAPATSCHRSTPPFHMSRPKLSHNTQFQVLAQTLPPWPRIGECTAPPPRCLSHLTPASPFTSSAVILNGTPQN